MSLSPGTRLGPYEILSVIGAGGMGEVYRARDTKLNRDVAIKVLPETVATDSERLARFHREAQVLASLNHPNIGAIYGLEESNGVRALVLETAFSPDGQSIAFWSQRDRTLRRISVSGGTPFTICQFDWPLGVSWSSHGIVLGGGNKGIMRVSAAGGKPERIASVNDGESAQNP